MSTEPEKKGRTRELVQEVAERILKSGQNPTQVMVRNQIRDEVGISPSPNLVSEELTKFWVEIGKRLAIREQRIAVPDHVLDMIEKMWDTALVEAGKTVASERAAASAEVGDARTAVEIAVSTATRLQAELDLAHENSRRLSDQLENAQTQVSALTTENAHLAQAQQSLASRVSDQAAAHRAEIERITQGHSAEITRLVDAHAGEVSTLRDEVGKQSQAWDGARKHLMLESDRVRESLRRDIERITAERDGAREMESQMRIHRSQAQEQIATLTGRVEQAEKELARAQGVIMEMTRDLASAKSKPGL